MSSQVYFFIYVSPSPQIDGLGLHPEALGRQPALRTGFSPINSALVNDFVSS